MQLQGRVWKDGGMWVIECPTLRAVTQGTSRKDALAMMVDWVQTTIDSPTFPIEIALTSKNEFAMRFEDPKPIVALMLSQNRNAAGLSLKEVADRIKAKSRTAVGQYETGNHDPGFVKTQQLLKAMGYDLKIELVAIAPPSLFQPASARRESA